ncbi:patatin-like phospholipase family protein [Mangrovibacterium marinum]|uniref:NTE family protein n=1 Tax=Mangrovibacterium marinum TaxID=1639118 RepID=A0A2T5C4P3_9BACT|nr:patatin-like phospholipase family protein [Mangrovibacterium marinum]PTN09845.1 NTE family protein [Mangrovibacterium marinum]
MKTINRLFSIFLIFLFLSNGLPLRLSAQPASPHHRPKVGLVLSGGGAKGFMHIGVLKVLEQEGIPVDIIVGTSIGSLIGGIYSIGYSADELEQIVQQQKWDELLSSDVSRLYLSPRDQALKQRYLFSLPINKEKKLSLPAGVIRPQNVLNLFCGLTANVPVDADFSNFPVKFACIAANIENGNEEVLDRGFLPTAMYASMAIPGVFMPGERDGKLLVDGGVVNNFPVDVAKKMGADIIIGVDIRDDYYEKADIKSMSEILLNLINFYSKAKDEKNRDLCDIVIKPDGTGYSGASFSRSAADTLIQRGIDAADAFRPALRALKEKYRLEPRTLSRQYIEPQAWRITQIELACKDELNKEFLLKNLNLETGETYNYADIKAGIDRLYGTGGFRNIYFELADNEKGKTLQLHLTMQEERSQNIGFRVNTTEAAALLLNASWKNFSRTFSLVSVSTELSANPGLNLLAETNWHHFPDLGFEVNAKFQNYNIYDDGKKAFDADLFYTSGKVYLEQRFRKFRTGFSAQQEYFDGDVFARDNTQTLSDATSFLLSGASFYASFDNMDHYYFPRKGTRLYVEATYNTDLKADGKNSPYLLFKMENVVPISRKVAFLANVYGRGVLNSNYPEIKSTFIGGEAYSRYFNYHLPFTGINPVMIGERFIGIGLVGLRFRLSSSQYLSVVFNSLQQGREYDEIVPELAIYGGGIKYNLKTFAGPLDITVGSSDFAKKPTFAANLGLWF